MGNPSNQIRVLHFLGTLQKGGTEASLLKILEKTRETSIAHFIVSYEDGEMNQDFRRRSAQVACVPRNPPFTFLRAPAFLQKLIGRIKPDIVQAYGLKANLLSRFVRSKESEWSLISSVRSEYLSD